jgi:hypothetical protein
MFKLRLDLTLSPVQLLSAAAVHPHPTLTSTCLDQASAQSCLMSFPLTTVPSNDSAFSDTLPTFFLIYLRLIALITHPVPLLAPPSLSIPPTFSFPQIFQCTLSQITPQPPQSVPLIQTCRLQTLKWNTMEIGGVVTTSF